MTKCFWQPPDIAYFPMITSRHIHQWLDARNSHDICQIELLLSEEVQMYQPQHPQPLHKADIKAYFNSLFQAYPDILVETDGFLINGHEVACWERLSGTFSGRIHEWQGMYMGGTAGNCYSLPCAIRMVYRSDGLIRNIRMYWDWPLLFRLTTP